MKKKIAILGIGKHVKINIFSNIQNLYNSVDIIKVHYNVHKSNHDGAITYENLLEREDITIVYNCLPNSLHYDTTKDLLHAGKHVLCEKPITLSFKEVKDLIDISCKKRLILREGFMYRYHQQMSVLKKEIQLIGDLLNIDIQFHYYLNDTSNIRFQKKMGGGIFNDVGCYCVDFFHWLGFKNFDEIIAYRSECNDVDISFFSLLFKDSIRFSFDLSLNTHRYQHISIKGKKGQLEIQNPFLTHEGQKVVIKRNIFNKPQKIIKINSNHTYHDQIISFIEEIEKKNIDDNNAVMNNVKLMCEIREISRLLS